MYVVQPAPYLAASKSMATEEKAEVPGANAARTDSSAKTAEQRAACRRRARPANKLLNSNKLETDPEELVAFSDCNLDDFE